MLTLATRLRTVQEERKTLRRQLAKWKIHENPWFSRVVYRMGSDQHVEGIPQIPSNSSVSCNALEEMSILGHRETQGPIYISPGYRDTPSGF